MKKIAFIISLLIGATTCYAQATGQLSGYTNTADGGVTESLKIYALGSMSDVNNKKSGKEFGVQGSAYTTDVFLPGKLFYKGDFEGNVFYRYNAYNEEIEVKDANLPGTPVRALNRDKNITLISTNGNPIKFTTYIDKKKLTQNGYLTELRSGEYTLYKRVDVKYTQGQKAQNSFVPALPARFTKFTEYYLQIEGVNKIQELELKKRKLIKLIPDNKKEEAIAFIKENGVKITDEYGVFKVLDYLNSK